MKNCSPSQLAVAARSLPGALGVFSGHSRRLSGVFADLNSQGLLGPPDAAVFWERAQIPFSPELFSLFDSMAFYSHCIFLLLCFILIQRSAFI